MPDTSVALEIGRDGRSGRQDGSLFCQHKPCRYARRTFWGHRPPLVDKSFRRGCSGEGWRADSPRYVGLYDRRGQDSSRSQSGASRVPDGCIIDSNGEPSTDPRVFYGDLPGAILPLSGHKGSGLSLIVEFLAGALGGGACTNPANAGRVSPSEKKCPRAPLGHSRGRARSLTCGLSWGG